MKKLFGFKTCPRCGNKLTPLSSRCHNCGAQLEFFSTDYNNRCGKCTAYIGTEDQYCRYCGAKRGEGEVNPYYDEPVCVYGPPPVNRLHICNECGYEWTTCAMIDEQRYCPKCGHTCKVISEDDPAEE